MTRVTFDTAALEEQRKVCHETRHDPLGSSAVILLRERSQGAPGRPSAGLWTAARPVTCAQHLTSGFGVQLTGLSPPPTVLTPERTPLGFYLGFYLCFISEEGERIPKPT